MRKTVFSLAIVSLLAGLVASGLHATSVLPMNFAQLFASAERVFIGTCASVSEGKTPEGLPYTEYRFTISEVLKGDLGETVTIRQFGQLSPRQVKGGMVQIFRIPSMPTYKSGQKMMLFLRSDSQLGLTSPVGLFQGAFVLRRDEAGEEVAVNGSNNVNLFRGMANLPPAALEHRVGPVKLSLLRTLLGR